MKLAIASIHDLNDIRRGSGTFYNLAQELERQGHTVNRLGPFTFDVPFAARLINGLHRRLGKRHPLFLDPFVGKRTGMQVAQRLNGLEYDVLLTKDMSMAAFTPTTKPVVIYTDVMITADYSERHLPGCRLGNMSMVALGLCRQTLRRALARSALAAFPTEWSARAARSHCREPGKVRVIPWGANLADPGPEIARGRTWEKVKNKKCLELLFVGKEWVRKGGDVAVEAVRCLNARGLKAKLHVVGVKVPGDVSPNQIHQYGLLDKSKPEDLQLLRNLYTEADAFILPSSSEGYVNSALEAAAFGLPALAYDTDGVRDAVVESLTGRLFPLGSPGGVFADTVEGWQHQPAVYEDLARWARQLYETRATWPSCVRTLMECIEGVVRQTHAAARCGTAQAPRQKA
jgi:glycosyltransferase involved in cell wall biosynthesis